MLLLSMQNSTPLAPLCSASHDPLLQVLSADANYDQCSLTNAATLINAKPMLSGQMYVLPAKITTQSLFHVCQERPTLSFSPTQNQCSLGRCMFCQPRSLHQVFSVVVKWGRHCLANADTVTNATIKTFLAPLTVCQLRSLHQSFGHPSRLHCPINRHTQWT